MKFLITYSSRTGNTRKIAEALAKKAPEGSVLSDMAEAPSTDDFDVIFVGYWIDRSMPDAKAKKFLHSLEGKKVVLFETMGADPTSEHAYTTFANTGTCLSEGNQVMGVLAFQGTVDPALIAMMKKMPAGSAHNSAQMEATTKEAAKHPNEEDFRKAEAYMERFVAKFEKYYKK